MVVMFWNWTISKVTAPIVSWQVANNKANLSLIGFSLNCSAARVNSQPSGISPSKNGGKLASLYGSFLFGRLSLIGGRLKSSK
jgi:hypothetical protein